MHAVDWKQIDLGVGDTSIVDPLTLDSLMLLY
jgi:hypothetical protein